MKLHATIAFAILVAFLAGMSFFIETSDFDYSSQRPENTLVASQLNHARLPFIENQGQADEVIKYYAKTFAGTIYVTDYDLTYHSIKKENDSAKTLIIKEKFLGDSLRPEGTEKSESIVNYFKGDQENWKTHIPAYNTVSLGQIWNNVDVDLRAHGNNVEKIFTVHPEGIPSDIRMSFDGITSLDISDERELKVSTDLGYMFLSKPIGYQIIDGNMHDVSIQYDILDSKTYGFSVLSYDPRFDLVIDPLIASTFIGGSGSEFGYGIARDSSGNVYITGDTDDALTDYPTTAGAFNNTQSGGDDAFVSKFNFALTTLSASTLIGGSGDDHAYSIALDSSGNVYITGETADASMDYPTTAGAFNNTQSGGDDVFVSKFNSTLTALSASTFIGSSGNDVGYGIAVDSSGNVYITGETVNAVTDLPITTGAYDTTHNGSNDAFVSKFNSALTTLSASTFIGSSGNDVGNDIFVDSSSNVYITGSTPDDTTDLPTTGGAYDTTHNGSNDAFVSKFNSALTTLSASTFIGGSSTDVGNGITVDSSGNVYITGSTTDHTTDLDTTTGAYDTTHNGVSDAFVSKFNSALTTLSASTFIGGSGNDFGNEIALDSSGNVYITGYTVDAATDFPTTTDAYDTTHNGGTNDVFVSHFDTTLSTLSASTFIGGSGNDFGYGIILDSAGNVYITGDTQDVATDLPTTTGAYDTTHNGGSDVFVSNFDCNLLLAGETCTPVLTSGQSASVTVAAGGTAEVETPSGNNLSVKLPAGVSGTITFTDTDSGTSDSRISFVGDIIDIDPSGGASCTSGCTISFTFTGSDASSAGYDPSEVTILHDSDENGSFEADEELTTTITGSDPYNATATASFTSKFAVGGVRANVAAAAQSLSAGGFFDFIDSCDPDGFAKGHSLKVYEISYDKCNTNKMQVLAYSTCGPIKAEVTTETGRYTLGISSTQPFLEEEPKKMVVGASISSELESFNIMIKDKRDSFTDKIILNHCNATKTYAHTTGYTSEQRGPIFFGEYDTQLQQEMITDTEPDVVIVEEPTEAVAEPAVHVDPEPVMIKQAVSVDPEPTGIMIDPEPMETKPAKSSKSIFDMLFKSFSRIFQR